MKYDDIRQEVPDSVVKGATGFVGVLAAIFLLPRVIRYAIRNYFFRLLAEIVAIVTLGLLTEKFARWLSPAGDADDGDEIAVAPLHQVPEEML